MAASGAPDRTKDHAKNAADVSLELLSNVRSIKLPSGLDIHIRIGIFFPQFNKKIEWLSSYTGIFFTNGLQTWFREKRTQILRSNFCLKIISIKF